MWVIGCRKIIALGPARVTLLLGAEIKQTPRYKLSASPSIKSVYPLSIGILYDGTPLSLQFSGILKFIESL